MYAPWSHREAVRGQALWKKGCGDQVSGYEGNKSKFRTTVMQADLFAGGLLCPKYIERQGEAGGICPQDTERGLCLSSCHPGIYGSCQKNQGRCTSWRFMFFQTCCGIVLLLSCAGIIFPAAIFCVPCEAACVCRYRLVIISLVLFEFANNELVHFQKRNGVVICFQS